MHQLTLLKILLLISAANTLQAADFCVTNTQEFRNALFTAKDNGESDFIRLVTGEYTDRFVFYSSESYNLTISGGWQGSTNNPCESQVADPFATKLSVDKNDDIMRIRTSADSHISISNLSIVGSGSDNALGMGIYSTQDSNDAPETGAIIMEQMAFLNHNNSSVLYIKDNRQIIIRNNLFVNNNSNYIANLSNSGNQGVYINNNTIINNNVGISVSISIKNNASMLVANNLMWNNQVEHYDLRTFDTSQNGFTYVYNNNIQNPPPQSYDYDVGNLSIQPIFQNGNANYMPAQNSVEFNGGVTVSTMMPNPPTFISNWQPGILDFNDNPRIQYGTIDIGATEIIETDLIFKNSFESIP